MPLAISINVSFSTSVSTADFAEAIIPFTMPTPIDVIFVIFSRQSIFDMASATFSPNLPNWIPPSEKMAAIMASSKPLKKSLNVEPASSQ